MKKVMILTVVLFTVASFSWAADQKDTIVSNQITTQQSSSNKNVAKQTKVKQPQSNWAKIKDLFM
jgi:hypothetical protein